MSVQEKEVKEGYKLTELGEIPVEWEVKKQGEVATFINGRAYKQSEFTRDGTPIVRIQNITGGKNYVYSDMVLPKEKYINNNDLIYTWSATFGPYLWKGDRAIFHYHIWKIEVDKTMINKLFFFYRLDYISVEMHSQKNGSAFAHITKGGMESHKILLPPLPEQQKIADILSTVDEQLEVIEGLIEKTKELKKGLMQRLLTKGIGHTEFKQTELGEIPVGWEVVNCNDIFKTISGIPIPRSKTGAGDYLYLHYGDIHKTKKHSIKTDVDDQWLSCINSEEIKIKNEAILSNGDIVIADASEDLLDIGKSIVIEVHGVKDIIAGLHTITLREISPRIDLKFKRYCFKINVIRKQFAKLATGTTVMGISKSNLLKVKFFLPPLPEQQKIASILSSVDEQIDTYEQEKEKVTELKKGLMQQLLTGKVRVTV